MIEAFVGHILPMFLFFMCCVIVIGTAFTIIEAQFTYIARPKPPSGTKYIKVKKIAPSDLMVYGGQLVYVVAVQQSEMDRKYKDITFLANNTLHSVVVHNNFKFFVIKTVSLTRK